MDLAYKFYWTSCYHRLSQNHKFLFPTAKNSTSCRSWFHVIEVNPSKVDPLDVVPFPVPPLFLRNPTTISPNPTHCPSWSTTFGIIAIGLPFLTIWDKGLFLVFELIAFILCLFWTNLGMLRAIGVVILEFIEFAITIVVGLHGFGGNVWVWLEV